METKLELSILLRDRCVSLGDTARVPTSFARRSASPGSWRTVANGKRLPIFSPERMRASTKASAPEI
jgi:hypothetical protein